MLLLATIQPDLADAAFALSMALLGVGMGLVASQLGLVVQSSVDASGRGEAGGLQYTGQQLGSSLGVALIGAIVLSGLTSNFLSTVATGRPDQRRGRGTGRRRRRSPGSTSSRRPTSRRPRRRRGSTRPRPRRVVDDYETAQLQALKVGLLAAALIALASLAFTRNLPAKAQAAEGESEARSSPEEPATATA